MSEPFVGEIRMFAGNFAPAGWAFCDGQLLAISQNDTLFSLIGTIYGGDGSTTFALPDLRGRLPIHSGAGPGLSMQQLGEKAGEEKVTLTVNQLPSHSHEFRVSTSSGTENNPEGAFVAASANVRTFRPATADTNLNASTVSNTGGSQSHTNLMPYLCLSFIIALFGIYPSRT